MAQVKYELKVQLERPQRRGHLGCLALDRRVMLTHYSGRVTQICVFNTVKLGTSASSP